MYWVHLSFLGKGLMLMRYVKVKYQIDEPVLTNVRQEDGSLEVEEIR
jgi:hypothetical protein